MLSPMMSSMFFISYSSLLLHLVSQKKVRSQDLDMWWELGNRRQNLVLIHWNKDKTNRKIFHNFSNQKDFILFFWTDIF